MDNKTAMQELMQWMEDTEFMVNKAFIEKVNECLEKEKEQIIEARIDGITCAAAFQEMPSKYTTGEQYYNETYGNGK